jgi:hypothetical protein
VPSITCCARGRSSTANDSSPRKRRDGDGRLPSLWGSGTAAVCERRSVPGSCTPNWGQPRVSIRCVGRLWTLSPWTYADAEARDPCCLD